MSKKKIHLYDLYIHDEYYNPVFHEEVVRAGTLKECQEEFKGSYDEWLHDDWNDFSSECYIGSRNTEEENKEAQLLRDELMADIQWFYDLKDGDYVDNKEIAREYFIDFVKTIEL